MEARTIYWRPVLATADEGMLVHLARAEEVGQVLVAVENLRLSHHYGR